MNDVKLFLNTPHTTCVLGRGDGKGRARNSSPGYNSCSVGQGDGAQMTRENSYRCALFTSVIT